MRRGTDSSIAGTSQRRQSVTSTTNGGSEDPRFHQMVSTFLGPNKHDSISDPAPRQTIYHQPQYINNVTTSPAALNYVPRPMGYYDQTQAYAPYNQQHTSIPPNQQPSYQYYSEPSTNNSLSNAGGGMAMSASLQTQPMFDGRTGSYTATPSNNPYSMTSRPQTYTYVTGFDDRSNGILQNLNYNHPTTAQQQQQPQQLTLPQQAQNLSSMTGIPIHGPPKYGVSPVPPSLLNNHLPSTQLPQPSLLNHSQTAGNATSSYGAYTMDQPSYHSLQLSMGNSTPTMSTLSSNLGSVGMNSSITSSLSNSFASGTNASGSLPIPYGVGNTQYPQQASFFGYNSSNSSNGTSNDRPPPVPSINNQSRNPYTMPVTSSNSGRPNLGPHPSSVRTTAEPYATMGNYAASYQLDSQGISTVKLPPIQQLGQN